jgi:hypothetical protein
MAVYLYNHGYDVHAYYYSAWQGAALPEVNNAVTHRGVSHIAIFGHSKGGGATYELANALGRPVDFTAYIDAVVASPLLSIAPEVRYPPGSALHVNYYQTNSTIQGAPTQPPAGGTPLPVNVDVTGWPGITHNNIDNNGDVQDQILFGSDLAAGLIDSIPQ